MYIWAFNIFSLEVGLNWFVLRIEVCHIDNKIFQNKHVTQWGNQGGFGQISVDFSDAGQRVEAITVHGARATNTLTTWSSEREGWVQVVLHVDQGIQVHWGNWLKIDVVADVFGFVVQIFRVVSVDQEPFHLWLLFSSQVGVELLDVVRVQVALHCGGHTLEEYFSFAGLVGRKGLSEISHQMHWSYCSIIFQMTDLY